MKYIYQQISASNVKCLTRKKNLNVMSEGSNGHECTGYLPVIYRQCLPMAQFEYHSIVLFWIVLICKKYVSAKFLSCFFYKEFLVAYMVATPPFYPHKRTL